MNDDRIIELVTAALDSVAPGWNKDVESLDLSMKMKELSIDSVSTMEMVGYIEEQLGVTFPDEDLAQVSRLEDLAGLIRKAAA